MHIEIRKFEKKDIPEMTHIWNQVVEEGIAFPQEKAMSVEEGERFFDSQTFSGVAFNTDTEKVVGLYILHPNNIGRCGHIANTSYAVDSTVRGQHIGEKLVKHSIAQTKEEGFRILQFNAVVSSNVYARHLYEKCGFKQLGTIPGGFRMKNGEYEDICPYYIEV